jgi:hypothetical protein
VGASENIMTTTAARPRDRATSAALMMTVRQWHTYMGAFIAPSVLFFAFTGSLQLFSLHEAHGSYTPPALVEGLGSVHKDQVFKLKSKPAAKGAQAEDEHDHAQGGDHHASAKAPSAPTPWPVMALKWLFLTVAVGLTTSTLLGLWLAFTFSRRKGVVLGLFAAGVVLPLLLVLA